MRRDALKPLIPRHLNKNPRTVQLFIFITLFRIMLSTFYFIAQNMDPAKLLLILIL